MFYKNVEVIFQKLSAMDPRQLLFALLLLFAQPLTGQDTPVIRENEKGEKIIVYPNGDWQYFYNFGKPEMDGKAQEQEGTSLHKYPVFDGTVDPMVPLPPVTEDDARKIFRRRSQIAHEAATIAEKRANEATNTLQSLQSSLQHIESIEQKRLLENQILSAKSAAETASNEAKMAIKEAKSADELTQKGNPLNELANLTRRQRKAIEQKQIGRPMDYNFFYNLVAQEHSTIQKQEPLPASAPPRNCIIAFEGKDEYTGLMRKDVHSQLLFTHTDERLRMFLKDKDYMRCDAHLTSLGGGHRFLSLQFNFAYPNAREAYGFIEKGSVLIVKLINGDFVTLRAGKMDKGSYDMEAEMLTYSVHYPIDNSQVGILKKSELDSLLVFWSSGYEEYKIYELDFFITQIHCLEN